jgi:hypothetical protein
VRPPEGDLPVAAGDGTSKSAASRRFVALSAERLAGWMASDLSQLDLLVIQVDGLHIGNDLVLVAALGIDGEGHKHPLGLVEGAIENAAVVQALIDNLIERGLDPKVCRLFIIDGAKALSKVIRRTFGAHTPIQRCQIHKARNVIERLMEAAKGFRRLKAYKQLPILRADQLHAAETAIDQVAQECRPAGLVLLGALADAENLPTPFRIDGTGHQQ